MHRLVTGYLWTPSYYPREPQGVLFSFCEILVHPACRRMSLLQNPMYATGWYMETHAGRRTSPVSTLVCWCIDVDSFGKCASRLSICVEVKINLGSQQGLETSHIDSGDSVLGQIGQNQWSTTPLLYTSTFAKYVLQLTSQSPGWAGTVGLSERSSTRYRGWSQNIFCHQSYDLGHCFHPFQKVLFDQIGIFCTFSLSRGCLFTLRYEN